LGFKKELCRRYSGVFKGGNMKVRSLVVFVTFLFVLTGLTIAGAEEKFGVATYPGAKFDAETTKVVAQMSTGGAGCYRTGDGVSKVVDFYKKQPGMKYMGGDKESAMLKKGKVDVTVQNPWMDMKTGKKNSDTLISIVNQK
jgi:hypothetical protein